MQIFIILLIGIAVLTTAIILYFKKAHPKDQDQELEKVIESVKEGMKEDLQGSANSLIKSFMWYVHHRDSTFNRVQKRRIKRHYEKFLWHWVDIPKDLQDVDLMVAYLVSSKHETRIVQRFVSEMKNRAKKGGKDVK